MALEILSMNNKIDELDSEFIQYYKDYKKIYVKNNKVYYVE